MLDTALDFNDLYTDDLLLYLLSYKTTKLTDHLKLAPASSSISSMLNSQPCSTCRRHLNGNVILATSVYKQIGDLVNPKWPK